MSRVRTSSKDGEMIPNTFSDFDWVRENREELFKTYGECVILVYHREIIGKGKTLNEATLNAEANLPADIQEVTPIVEYLSNRHPVSRFSEKT